jgi:hypothetical protein
MSPVVSRERDDLGHSIQDMANQTERALRVGQYVTLAIGHEQSGAGEVRVLASDVGEFEFDLDEVDGRGIAPYRALVPGDRDNASVPDAQDLERRGVRPNPSHVGSGHWRHPRATMAAEINSVN